MAMVQMRSELHGLQLHAHGLHAAQHPRKLARPQLAALGRLLGECCYRALSVCLLQSTGRDDPTHMTLPGCMPQIMLALT